MLDLGAVEIAHVLSRGLVSKNTSTLKVRGNGELARKLTVRAQKFSKSAAQKITDAGGTLVHLDRRGREVGAGEPAAAAPAAGASEEQGGSGAE